MEWSLREMKMKHENEHENEHEHEHENEHENENENENEKTTCVDSMEIATLDAAQ